MSWDYVAITQAFLDENDDPTLVTPTTPLPVTDAATLAKLEAIRSLVTAVNLETTQAAVLSKLTDIQTTEAATNVEVTQLAVLAKLNEIFGAVDGLELTADNIALNADNINLNTDQVEALLQTLIDKFPASGRDDGNSTLTPPGAGLAYDGAFKRVDNYGAILAFALSNQNFATPYGSNVRIEWSDNGTTANGKTTAMPVQTIVSGPTTFYLSLTIVTSLLMQGTYYRIHVKEGAVASTLFATIALISRHPFTGTFKALADPLNQLSVALLTQSVIAGIAPDGSFQSVSLSAGHSLRVQPTEAVDVSPLGVNSFDTENGSPIPTNAAPWLGTREFMGDYPQQTIIFDREPFSAFGEIHFTYSKTDTGTAAVPALPIKVIANQPSIPVELANVGPWFKADFIPDAASPAITNARLTILKFRADAPDLTRFFNQDVLASTEPVKMQRSGVMGLPPDFNDSPDSTFLRNVRVSGPHTLGSLTTPMAANTSLAGKWFLWQGDYITALTTIESDVSLTWRLEFSSAAAPVDYVDDDVDSSTNTFSYAPVDGVEPRGFIVQSVWVRLKIFNGSTAQSELRANIAFLTTPLSSGIKHASEVVTRRGMVTMVDAVTTNQTDESVAGAEVYVQDRASLGSVSGKRGKNVHLTGIDVSVAPALPDITDTGRFNVSAGGFSQLPPPVTINPQTVQIINLHADGGIVSMGTQAKILAGQGHAILAMIPMEMDYNGQANRPFFRLDAGTAPLTSTDDRFGTGTANNVGVVNPGNLNANDAAFATFDAATDSVDITGITAAAVYPAIASVLVAVKAAKGTNQTTELVTPIETQVGAAGAVGSVASAALASGALRTYVAFISREVSGATVATISTMSGLGLTWTQVGATENSDDAHRRLDCWVAVGTGTTGAVTASFATLPISSRIVVRSYSGVHQTTTVEDSDVNAVNSAAVTVPALTCTNRGYALMAAAINNATSTPGAGYTEDSDQSGTTGTSDNLTLVDKAITATGTETPTATLSGAKHYAAIGITLRPALAVDPIIRVRTKIGGVISGTAAMFTLSSTAQGEITPIDITSDRAWTAATLADTDLVVDSPTIGAATGLVDSARLTVTETEANASASMSYMYIGGGSFA